AVRITEVVRANDRTCRFPAKPRPSLQSGSFLQGIGKLDEHLAIELLEAPLLIERAVVAITEKHHRLPVELVGEESRTAEEAIVRRRRLEVERRITIRRHILADQPDEAARGKCVVRPDAFNPRGK